MKIALKCLIGIVVIFILSNCSEEEAIPSVQYEQTTTTHDIEDKSEDEDN